jgi:hypothetical protein
VSGIGCVGWCLVGCATMEQASNSSLRFVLFLFFGLYLSFCRQDDGGGASFGP